MGASQSDLQEKLGRLVEGQQQQQQQQEQQQSKVQQHGGQQQHQQLRPQRQPQQQPPQQPHVNEPLITTNKELGHEIPAPSSSRRETWLLSPSPQHDVAAAGPSTRKNNAKANETTHHHQSKSTNTIVPKPLMIKVPHNYENILKDADSPVDKSSTEKLLDQLYAGVFLNHKTKKYWVDKKSNANCFLLYARALSITWAEDQNYWKWIHQKDASGTIALAELESVCWLEVHAKFDTRKLSPGILYQVSFVIMLKDPAQGWEVPVNVRLVLPGGKKQNHKENLIEKLRAQWIEIPVGEFMASEKDAGEMEISMYEYEGGMWKQGLIIKGIAIKPKD